MASSTCRACSIRDQLPSPYAHLAPGRIRLQSMRSERLRVGFLMDPLEEILVHHDSTFALMLECGRRGHEVLSFHQQQLYALDGRVRSAMRSVAVRREQGRHFDELSTFDAGLDELDIVFLRKDPPVDVEFWHATQLVELAGERPFFINSPAGLRDANEKLWALRFPELTPRTLVSSDLRTLRSFIRDLGRVVLKPIDAQSFEFLPRVSCAATWPPEVAPRKPRSPREIGRSVASLDRSCRSADSTWWGSTSSASTSPRST